MSRARTVKGNVLFIFLAAAALLLSGIASALSDASAQQAQVTKPITGVGVSTSILSDLKGVDFAPYMRAMHDSIMRNLSAKLPESVKNGQKGIVVLQVRLQKDGSLPDDAATITRGSGRDDMDAASISTIRAAAPFGPLPEGYSGSNLELKFAFYFNIPPQKPAEKSRPAPAS
ncbi:MAG: TonB family protein [Candidatus Acidiferrales bacterium]